MSGPFTYPVAFSIPFENEPERSNGFISDNVQEAIEEGLALAISNDVFLALMNYNGNANVGRHLEFYPGINSNDAPLHLSKGSNVISLIARTTAAVATCKIGFFDKSVSVIIPVYEIEFINKKTVILEGSALNPVFDFAAHSDVLVKITEGSINTPHVQMVFSSALNGGTV